MNRFIAAITALALTATPAPAAKAAPATPFSVQQITTANGLPSNKVNAICQDRKGYMWFGTTSGLCRYDGYSVVNFRSLSCDKSKNIEACIIGLQADSHGLIWVNTSTGVIACYDTNRSRFADYSTTGDYERPFAHIDIKPSGTWLYGPHHGARRCTYRNGKFGATDFSRQHGNLPADNVIGIVCPDSAHTWVATAKGMVAVTANGTTKRMLYGKDIAAATSHAGKVMVLECNGQVTVATPDGKITARGHAGFKTQAADITAAVVWQDKWIIFTGRNTFAINIARQPRPDSTPAEIMISEATATMTESGIFVSNRMDDAAFMPHRGKAVRLRLTGNLLFDPTTKQSARAAVAAGGSIWISSRCNGMFVYHPNSGTTYRYPSTVFTPQLYSKFMASIFAGKDGELWVCNENAGVTRITGSRRPFHKLWLPAPQSTNDLANHVRHVSHLGADSFLISTRSNELLDFLPETGMFGFRQETAACVYSYLRDRQGRRWIGTRGHGLYIDGKHYIKNYKEGGLTDNSIYDIKQDRQGRVWLATWGGGLLMAQAEAGGKITFRPFLRRSMREARVRAIELSDNGTMWVATSNGLYMARTGGADFSDGSFKLFSNSAGNYPINEIICLMADSGNTVYTGGLGCGLVKATLSAKGDRLDHTAITTTNGLASNNVQSIAKDKYGYIWAGTEEGVSRVNPNTLTALRFKFNESMSDNVFSENAVDTDTHGNIVFGTSHGVVAITPFELSDKRQVSPKPFITNIMVNRHPLFEDSAAMSRIKAGAGGEATVQLRHNQNYIDIFFSNMVYNKPHTTFYKYRLDGIDKEWRLTADNPHAQYSELQPGTYRFRLRSACDDGLWSNEAQVEFYIASPWYATWWAWAAYILAAGAVAFFIYRQWLDKFKMRQEIDTQHKITEFRLNFFTHIAHELRTPLALIQGSVEKLQEPATERAMKAAAQTAMRGTNRLLRQVNQLMEFRRINTHNMKLNVEHDNIIKFVRAITDDFRLQAQQKGQTLTLTPFAAAHTMAFDKRIVETIAYNLIGNAIKYTPEQGCIGIRIWTEDGMLCMSVTDNGNGIDAGQRQRMFKPFMHGYVSAGGMGIGLFNAYSMAAIHKGRLDYKPAAPHGSVFTLQLPLDEDLYRPDDFKADGYSRTPYKQPAEDIVEFAPKPLNNKTVAIIEDDSDMMQQIKAETGIYFNTLCFSSGTQALYTLTELPGKDNGGNGMVSATQAVPDIILCDVMMPEIDGYEVVRRLKRNAATAQIPVIMLTALDDDNHMLRGYKAGADDYMAKPCNYNILVARMAKFIEWSGQNAANGGNENTTADSKCDNSVKAMVTSAADSAFISRMQAIIAKHAGDENFGVDNIAEAMRMGRTKFYGKVKELFGVTPNNYLINERMRIAARLLDSGDLNVSEVCYRVGMSNQSYFIKRFKESHGMTPSEYRKSTKKEAHPG